MSLPTYKVIVIGDENTGKTSIIHQYTRKSFPMTHFLTPLPIEHSKNVNNKCNLIIWDTAGVKEWQSMNETIYHNSNAVIYLSSFDNQQSLRDLKDVWFPKVNQYLKNIPTIMAVNKDDLDDDHKLIEINEIEEMKDEISACELIFVSAKDYKNVDELFGLVADKLAENTPPSDQSVDINAKKSEKSEKGGGCGC